MPSSSHIPAAKERLPAPNIRDEKLALPPSLPAPGRGPPHRAVGGATPQTPRLRPSGNGVRRPTHRLAPAGGSLEGYIRRRFPSNGHIMVTQGIIPLFPAARKRVFRLFGGFFTADSMMKNAGEAPVLQRFQTKKKMFVTTVKQPFWRLTLTQ